MENYSVLGKDNSFIIPRDYNQSKLCYPKQNIWSFVGPYERPCTFLAQAQDSATSGSASYSYSSFVETPRKHPGAEGCASRPQGPYHADKQTGNTERRLERQ